MRYWNDEFVWGLERLREEHQPVANVLVVLNGVSDGFFLDQEWLALDGVDDLNAKAREVFGGDVNLQVASPIPGIGSRLIDSSVISKIDFCDQYDLCAASVSSPIALDTDYFRFLVRSVRLGGVLLIACMRGGSGVDVSNFVETLLLYSGFRVLEKNSGWIGSADSKRSDAPKVLVLLKERAAELSPDDVYRAFTGLDFSLEILEGSHCEKMDGLQFVEFARSKAMPVSVWGLNSFGVWCAMTLIGNGVECSLFDRTAVDESFLDHEIAMPDVCRMGRLVCLGTSDVSTRDQLLNRTGGAIIVSEGRSGGSNSAG